jgi:hypothetical protein
MKSAIEDCLSNRNLLKILLFIFLYIFIIFFQICLSRHIYNRMHHQNYRTWFYNQQIYIFTRSLELVRFCSSRFSVSTYDLIFIAALLKHHFFFFQIRHVLSYCVDIFISTSALLTKVNLFLWHIQVPSLSHKYFS